MFSVIRNSKPLTQRGDTLVEVLLSIAIISTILSGAYIVTNKSLIASRESQERGNALKLSQGQIERIKSMSTTDPDKLFGPALVQPFCINDANEVVKDDNDACLVDAEGNHTDVEPVYKMSITRGADSHTFTLKTTWSSLKSDQDNSVQLIYKVY